MGTHGFVARFEYSAHPAPILPGTWSAVCHMTELSGGRVAGGLAGAGGVQLVNTGVRDSACVVWPHDVAWPVSYVIGTVGACVVKVVSRQWAIDWAVGDRALKSEVEQTAARGGWSQPGHGK